MKNFIVTFLATGLTSGILGILNGALTVLDRWNKYTAMESKLPNIFWALTHDLFVGVIFYAYVGLFILGPLFFAWFGALGAFPKCELNKSMMLQVMARRQKGIKGTGRLMDAK